MNRALPERAADTTAGSSGPSLGSRQTWVSGGAIQQAALAVRNRLFAPLGERYGMSPELLQVRDGRVVSYDGIVDVPIEEVVAGQEVEETVTYRPAPTEPLGVEGQGDAFAFHAQAHGHPTDLEPRRVGGRQGHVGGDHLPAGAGHEHGHRHRRAAGAGAERAGAADERRQAHPAQR